MKIGIITLCQAVNYGAYLQAFALGQFLKDNGQDVQYITSSSFKSWYWRMHNLYAYHLDRILFRKIFRKKWVNAQKLLRKTKKKKGYDLIIIGSDEMWQLNGKTVKPLPEYWGIGVEGKKKITYAVCSNGTTTEQAKQFPFISEGIKGLDSISARDTMTQKAYQPLAADTISLHVDPTFLVDLNKYAVEPQYEKYVLVYTYSFDKEKIEQTRDFAEENELKIITVGNKFDWCDVSIPASPFEVLGFFKNAEFVITDTFHGTVLSIHFKRQFCSYADGKEKILEVLKEFELEDRNVSRYSLKNAINNQIDYTNVFRLIEKKKQVSCNYLKSFIERGEKDD